MAIEKLDYDFSNRGSHTEGDRYLNASTFQNMADKTDEIIDYVNSLQQFIENSTMKRVRYFSNEYSNSLTIPNVKSSSHIILFIDSNGFAVIWKAGATYDIYNFNEYGALKISDNFDIKFEKSNGSNSVANVTISSKDGRSHIISAICIAAFDTYS